MFKALILFVFGLLLLIKGGDWFVDSATGVAHRFHVPEIIIGATIVSIGTTLPEVMVSAQSAALGQGEIAYGNAIGSIICNTALIAAITIAIRPPHIERKTFVLPVIFFFIAAAIYVIVAYAFDFSRPVGIVLLAVFVIYMAITIFNAVKASKKERELIAQTQISASAEPDEGKSLVSFIRDVTLVAGILVYFIVSFFHSLAAMIIAIVVIAAYVALSITDRFVKSGEVNFRKFELIRQIAVLIVGAAVIALGARLLVDNGTIMAENMGVPQSVIGLTFVAIGTSLPELVTAITSLVKKHGSLSLGNIIGANLFNLVLVSGVSMTIAPFEVPATKMIGSLPASLVIDIPVMLAVMLFLTLPAIIRGKLSRWQGITLLVIYTAFFVTQFAL